MRDTIGKRIYRCKCGTSLEEYVWSSKLAATQFCCVNCGKILGFINIIVKRTAQSAAIRTPTKNR
jgi:hypothetical protein